MRFLKLSLLEGTVLVLVGLLLTVATVRDLTRQVSVNHRLIADLNTWRVITGLDYHNLSLGQNHNGRGTREVVCGNTTPGAPKVHTRVCLVMSGPVIGGRRNARGGYYLAPLVPDLRRYRYGCFGSALAGRLCGLSSPPVGAHPIPLVGAGQS